MTSPRPALFLDRDGVLNEDRGFVSRVEDFVWIDGAIDCVRRFNQLGWWVFVVTNQSGIAFGSYTEADMTAVHSHMLDGIGAGGGAIDQIYFSPTHPDASVSQFRADSVDRKPGPGMLNRAMTDFPVIKDQSFLIGDKPTDIAAAQAAGIDGFLFKGGNLKAFATQILAERTDQTL